MQSRTAVDGNDLIITRRIAAGPQAVWEALTDAEKLKQWFAPRPWKITECLMEPRPGGRFLLRMQGPEGQPEECVAEGEEDTGGCVLEAVAPRRLVWTDALSAGWRPNGKPFMTAVITIEPDGAGSIYTARVLHRNDEDRQRHSEMGFAEGWGACLEQLAELVE